MLSEGSPIVDEFSEFIKTCSKKYHCSVFGATNHPLSMIVDYNDPNIFPVKMSIDIPNDKNAKAMFEYYLEDKTSGDIDLDNVLSIMHQQEEEKGGRYSNGQIRKMVFDVFNRDQKNKVMQQDLERQVLLNEPEISPETISKFQRDYDELIGKEW
jgi:SpoVK/Ycf46/Vps4 family AAA+-type ATPase